MENLIFVQWYRLLKNTNISSEKHCLSNIDLAYL